MVHRTRRGGTEMVNRTVLISGAGIGGPALAFWLRRHGFAPTVVEVAAAPRPGGHAVDLPGAGREVVERMGLLDTVRAERVDERGFAYADGRGRWTARMPADLFDGEGMVAEIEIMRGNLTRILYDATRDGIEYLFDDWIAGLTEDGDGVKVTFASGTVRRFGIVVGADGLHSGVRRLAFGPEQEFVRHLGGYMAYFTVPDPGNLDHWFLMHGAPGGLVAGIRPENGGTAKAMLSFTSPPLDYDRRDVLAQQEILRAKFTGVGWLVPQILAAMPGAGTSTSTRSVRSTWDSGTEGGRCCSATPDTAARRWPGSVPRWPSSPPTCSPVNCPRHRTTTRRHSPGTRMRCATT